MNYQILFRWLLRTKERFYIQDSRKRSRIEDGFYEACSSINGFKVVELDNYSMKVYPFYDKKGWILTYENLDSIFKIKHADSFHPTNAGFKTCFNCDCPTVLKRDFATMRVREFCPRCKF